MLDLGILVHCKIGLFCSTVKSTSLAYATDNRAADCAPLESFAGSKGSSVHSLMEISGLDTAHDSCGNTAKSCRRNGKCLCCCGGCSENHAHSRSARTSRYDRDRYTDQDNTCSNRHIF